MDNDTEAENKIRELLKEIKRTPFHGLGKTEALRHNLKGFWSRRITDEHRLVYQISGTKGEDQQCAIVQCRFIIVINSPTEVLNYGLKDYT